MLFPAAARIIYRKSPLEQVICQLRFPPILRIDTGLPVDFQDRVRSDFPGFTETTEGRLELPRMVGDVVPADLLREALQSSRTKNYAFTSADGSWRINLTRTFIAFTTTSYERWESFRERLLVPLEATKAIYAPNYFSRIGLRYVNVISRSTVGLPNAAWNDLLSPALTGMLGSADIADSVETYEAVHEIGLSDQGGKARITAKLIKRDSQLVFGIDGDFFNTSRIQPDAALGKLDFLHSQAIGLIRWAITERLHQAMEPYPL